MDESRFPHREIGEEEDDLLERLWAEQGCSGAEGACGGFADVKRRIRRRLRRRAAAGILAGSVLALLAASVVRHGRPESAAAPDSYELLAGMGVAVDRSEVVMTADDGLRIVLGEEARIESRSADEVTLNTGEGERTTVASERRLRVDVPAGRRFRLTLSDGSEVWLNAGSSLEYPATFPEAAERRVRVEGEAFFDVCRDTCRPFCVELDDGACIRVLGTSFNVCAYADAPSRTTTLLSGHIRYDAGAGPVDLFPDQSLTASSRTGAVEVRRVDAAAACAWRDGWICFENEPLSEIAGRLARLYGIRIEVAEAVGGCRFSGRLRQERGIDYLLQLLSETSDIVCEVEEGAMKLR